MIQKVIYKSQSCVTWGEFEIDHIFFLKEDFHSIPYNTNEIGELKWLTREEFKPFLELRQRENQEDATPWLKGIVEYQLMGWWKMLEDGSLD